VPSGIDSIIRGVLKWAPPDLEYVLFGATSDPATRPVGQEAIVSLGERRIRYIPIVSVDPSGSRRRLPLTVRYMWALRKCLRDGALDQFNVLDFHRVEPVSLFVRDSRPKNLVVHTDMASLRNKGSDIMWRHAPWLYEAVERKLFRSIDRIFCVRQNAVQRYATTHPEIAERFAFMPTWVDTGVFQPGDDRDDARAELRRIVRRDLGGSESSSLLVSVGRLDHSKDPLLLIEAFRTALRHHPGLHLAMVGDGVLRARVTETCASHDLRSRVSILGARPGAEIARLLRASDLFVLSSAYEGMPISVLEALATGTPVVTTDVGEIRLVVREGVNGYIASERTAEALGSAICHALDKIDVLRGAPCTRSVEPYHPERVLTRIYDNHRRQGQRLAG